VFAFGEKIGIALRGAIGGTIGFAADLASSLLQEAREAIGSIEITAADVFSFGEKIGAAIRGAIAGTVGFAVDLAGEIGNEVMQAVPLAGAAILEADWSSVANSIKNALVAAVKGLATLGAAVLVGIAGLLKGLVFGEGDVDWSSLATSIGTGIVTAIGAIADFGSSVVTKIFDLINNAPNISVGAFLSLGGKIAVALKDAFVQGIANIDWSGGVTAIYDGLIGAANLTADAFAGLGSAIVDAIWQSMKSAASNLNPLSLFTGGDASGETGVGEYIPEGVPVGEGGGATGSSAPPGTYDIKIRGDRSDFDTMLTNIQNGEGVTPIVVKSTFDADTGPAAIAYTEVMGWGEIWASTSFDALFGADTGPAAIAYTEAFSWGDIWSTTPFNAQFGAETGGAAIAYTEVMSWGDIYASTPFIGQFEGDTGGAAIAYSDVMAWGGIYGSSTFTGTFAGNTGPAAIAYSDVMNWGSIWQNSTFTATFAANTGPAAIAYTDAMSWGSIWDGTVFTASFSVDTSGITNAVGVARAAAQEISDLLPHSPAKKGPLSKPISFDHIAQAARRDLSGIGTMVAAALSPIAETTNSLAGVMVKYFRFVHKEGDAQNDWLTHMPKSMRSAALLLGKSAQEFATPISQYFKEVQRSGDYMNASLEDLTDLPKALRAKVIALGKQIEYAPGFNEIQRERVGDRFRDLAEVDYNAARRYNRLAIEAERNRSNPGSSNTFVVMTRAEINEMFKTVDTVRVLTTADEVAAVFGGR
jgi:hypothetical protein